MAAGVAGRRLGDYVKNLTTKFLVWSTAGTVFLAAIVFAILAIFWALTSQSRDPVASAAIMAGALALIGCLIVPLAYGITREKPQSVSQALRDPAQAVQSQIPSVEEIGRQIERAARKYGPVRVIAAAAAGGLAAGVFAKRFGQDRGYAPQRTGRNGRRYPWRYT